MSKVALVRALLVGGIKQAENDSSIHRFQGFNKLYSKRILIWKGFEFQIDISSSIQSSRSNVSENMEADVMDTFSTLLISIQENLNRLDISHATYQIIFHSEIDQTSFISYINSSNASLPVGINIISTTQVDARYILNTSVTNISSQFIPLFRECSYFKVQMSTYLSNQLTTYTRENNETAKVDIKGLTSHKLHGIDNTGNVCVWASESMLLYTLLHNTNLDTTILRGKNVLELGGGMTALCGLSLAALSLAHSVVLTDGHPDCVRNQRFCIQLNRYMNSSSSSSSRITGSSNNKDTFTSNSSTEVSSEQLRWTAGDIYGEIKNCTRGGSRQFDLIIGCDILFFADFHDGLLEALCACLAPSGTVLLLQPPRGGTMKRFIDLASESGYFQVTVSENYNEQV